MPEDSDGRLPLLAPLVPALKVPQFDSSHRGLRQLKSPRHLTRGRTLAGFANDLFKPLAEWRLRRKLLDLFHPDATFRTSQAMYFHNHGGPKYAPRQVPDLPLAHIMNFVQAATASATLKVPVTRLTPHPQLESLRLFV